METKSQKVLRKIAGEHAAIPDLAKGAEVRRKLMPHTPGGMFDGPLGRSPRIFTPSMKGSLWGKAENVTLSLLKNDVYDRRYHVLDQPFTLEQVVKGAFSEKNSRFDDMPHSGQVRSKPGVLVEEGGRRNFQAWSAVYAFPCQKPVGQIILQAQGMKGAGQPEAVHSLEDGGMEISMQGANGASLRLCYAMSVHGSVTAVRAAYQNQPVPPSFRLYRHTDQAHRKYMDEQGNFIPENERPVVYWPSDGKKEMERYRFEDDVAFNGPFDPPQSGCDGPFFWISQKFPSDRTFPEGFEYVMMGLTDDGGASLDCEQGKKGLGSPLYAEHESDEFGNLLTTQQDKEKRIYELELETGMGAGFEGEFRRQEYVYSMTRNAPGAAATAVFSGNEGVTTGYFVVVTSNDGPDLLAEAKRRLLAAREQGFDKIQSENAQWYQDLYERRQRGRFFVEAPQDELEEIDRKTLQNAYKSWSHPLAGFCAPDPAKLEGGASFAGFDMDAQSWHSMPCYNELFPTRMLVCRQQEWMSLWVKLVDFWRDAFCKKARDSFGLPGMTMTHGYLPPVRPDSRYVQNQCLDYCLDTSAQVLKVLWDLWDYQGDEALLAQSVYPAMRELAIFFEAFARRGWDGTYYHLSPVVEPENWGISYQLKYATDTTAALSMFRKTFRCAIEGAQLLGRDADKIPGWQEVLDHLAPYPRFQMGSGEILGGNAGAIPRWSAGDHGHFTGLYPATLADDINLDSTQEEKDLIVRSMDAVRCDRDDGAYILVGALRDRTPSGYAVEAQKIETGAELADQLFLEPERLLNSRSGRIHLFPAVPDWAEVSFAGFLARGGFEVSAARDASGVTAATVRATRSVPLLLMNPWPGKAVKVTDCGTGADVAVEQDLTNGECLCVAAQAGHCYSFDLA